MAAAIPNTAVGAADSRRRASPPDSYCAWREAAEERDRLSSAAEWRRREDTGEFDSAEIRSRMEALDAGIDNRDPGELLFLLHEGVHGNIAGVGHPALYEVAEAGTKHLITEYFSAVVRALDAVAAAPDSELSLAEKLAFFQRASISFGRSALMLSGGGGRIYFHHGVVDALLDEGLLPSVLSGSSAGGWVCAQLGARRDDELQGYFAAKRYAFGIASSALATLLNPRKLRNGTALAAARRDVIADLAGDMTFAEAYEHSGRMINISVASPDKFHRGRLLNAITSPDVTLRSACLATSCLPQYSEPEMLEAKDRNGRVVPYLPGQRWIDGGLADDLPMKRLQRLYGVNHFIVSQINPLSAVIPFLRADRKSGKDGPIYQASNIFFGALREGAKFAQRSLWPVNRVLADAWLEYFYRLADQNYAGDVTIEAGFDARSLEHSVFNFVNDAEIADLIMDGRRATWPRIEQIRNATMVSKALGAHLSALEDEAAGSRSMRRSGVSQPAGATSGPGALRS
jgi:TAG lipase / steryl ester hydrolase / phospholipase A2 / LPA acyltransferase